MKLAEALVTEVDAISDAWYTRNKWPRGRVAYTKLFLPVVHLVIAICFTAEHFFGQLSLSGLQRAAAAAVTTASAPLRSLLGHSMVQTLVHLAGFRLPDVLQEYTFYFVFFPVFTMMIVRPPPQALRVPHRASSNLTMTLLLMHQALFVTVSGIARPMTGSGAPRCAEVRSWCSVQGTLLSWAKEVEPQATSVHSIIQGVTEGANADALRFFDLDKSHVTRWLRCDPPCRARLRRHPPCHCARSCQTHANERTPSRHLRRADLRCACASPGR